MLDDFFNKLAIKQTQTSGEVQLWFKTQHWEALNKN